MTTRRPTWARASTIVLGRPIASFREPHLKAEDGMYQRLRLLLKHLEMNTVLAGAALTSS